MNDTIRTRIIDKKRIVVKIGSSSLQHKDGGTDYIKMDVLVRELCNIRNMGKDVVLVTSGAIAEGKRAINNYNSDNDMSIAYKQACAAIGQARLMMIYQKIFAEYNHIAAQILMTVNTINNDINRRNAYNTFAQLLSMGVIPIVNENDTVATHELGIGDNDTLSAIVTYMIGADLLILLSDIDGLYTDDPRCSGNAVLIDRVPHITSDILNMGKHSVGSSVGTGGMSTKLIAAHIATASGADMIIANGSDARIIHRIMDGRNIGTFFDANPDNDYNIDDYIEHIHDKELEY